MAARAAALVAVLMTVAACSTGLVAAPAALSPGTSTQIINAGGVDRSYRVYVPADLPSPAPLVVMLHGGFGSAEQAESSYGWDQLADVAKFVVAYPDGLGRAWNAGGCCGRPAREGIDDIGFISSVVDAIGAGIAIDRDRVYATGISNGGMMAYALACNTDVFAAIGPDAATQLDPCGSPRPTSVLHIHGTDDRTVRYDGGPGTGIAGIDGPPVPELISFWGSVGQCAPVRERAQGPVTMLTAICPDGGAVQLIAIAGAGHQWPGSRPVRVNADPPSTVLNATAMFWQFFSAHRR